MAAEWEWDDEDSRWRPARYFRSDWERDRRLTSAELFEQLAATAPDEACARQAHWQAALFRWNAEHTQ